MFRWLLALFLGIALVSCVASPAVAAEWVVNDERAEPMEPPPPIPEGWLTAQGRFVEVHGDPAQRITIEQLARHAAISVPALANEMQVPIGDTIHIYVAPSQAAFVELQPGTPPSYADATAYPSRGAIFLRAERVRGTSAAPIEQVLDHEIVHILLGRAFYPELPPRWLQEGVAQVYANEFGPNTTRELARGMLGRSLYPLDRLEWGFPDDPHRARLAYAQSADLIAWMQLEYGEDVVPRLISGMRTHGDLRKAVHSATGHPLEEVDRRWRARLNGDGFGVPLWVSNLGNGDLVWFITAVLGVLAIVVVRRRLKTRRAAYRAREREEEALMAAIWDGRFAPAPRSDPPWWLWSPTDGVTDRWQGVRSWRDGPPDDGEA